MFLQYLFKESNYFLFINFLQIFQIYRFLVLLIFFVCTLNNSFSFFFFEGFY